MLGRLFGKDKDQNGEAVCAECGRTLLGGEWTQRVEDEDGNERVLCSLCGQSDQMMTGGERHTVGNGSANATLLPNEEGGDAAGAADIEEPVRDENAALWKAIKDRDAQIERLKDDLARGEAERQELAGRLARLQAAAEGAAAASAALDEPAPVAGAPATLLDEPEAQTADAPEEPETTVESADETTAGPVADGAPQAVGDDTAEIVMAGEGQEAGTVDAGVEPAEDAGAEPAEDAGVEQSDDASPDETAAEAPGAEETAEQAASMTLLQRGVDLLNVSPVPRKIAETNADLGIPTVHVGFDGATATVTFMWSMGWYRFTVDVDSGSVRLGDRGYVDLESLQPNASVRADGTVQLAPAMISRAAAQRQEAEQAAAPPAEVAEEPAETPAEGASEPVAPATGGPEILSKSLLGQRTDDERPSWEGTQARDFDWDR